MVAGAAWPARKTRHFPSPSWSWPHSWTSPSSRLGSGHIRPGGAPGPRSRAPAAAAAMGKGARDTWQWGSGAPAAPAGAWGRPGGHRGASLQPRGPGGLRNPAAPPRAPPAAAAAPGRSLLRAELSRGEPEPRLPLASAALCLPSLSFPWAARAFLPGLESGRRGSGGAVLLVLDRVFVPAAARPLRTGGRHGRRRPRSHGAEGERRRLGPARERSLALPGGTLCPQLRRPEPAICRQAQKFRGPRAAETRLFMADPPSGGALGRRGPGKWGGGAERGGRRDRGGGGGGQPRLQTPPRPRSHRRASASRDSPGRDPGAPGLEEVAVSARGARRGRARASGSRDLDTGAGDGGGRWRTKEGERGAGTFSVAPG